MAVITGATGGVGLACARGFLAAGAEVTIHGETQDAVEAAVASLLADYPGRTVLGVAADLGEAAGCETLMQRSPDCDFLVNNFGVATQEDALSASDETYVRLYELNLMSSVRLSRGYLPGMLRRNRGRVIFRGEQRALTPHREGAPYAVSKMAQLNFARSLADMTRGAAVTVNTVLVRKATSRADRLGGRAPARVALDRAARADEVANFILY